MEREHNMKTIVYQSNTGSAQRYAQMLAEKLDMPCMPLKLAKKELPAGEEAVYIGWVRANTIVGYAQAAKRWKLTCAAAVGMNPNTATYLDILKQHNKTSIPLFYLRGGLDLAKLKGLNKLLIKAVREDILTRSDDDTGMTEVLRSGADLVSEDDLTEIIAFLLIQ